MSENSVLLVDDELIVRMTLAKALENEKLSVTVAASGDEAIRAVQEAQYDLLITDLVMEGSDGFEVARVVKEQAPQTGIILMTGYINLATAMKALEAGVDDFLVKPFEVEELAFRSRRCLEKKRLVKMLMEKTRQLEQEIHSRRLIEESLLESEKRLRLALDVSSNGVWDHSVVTQETYVGENWYRTLGYQADEVKNYAELVHPEDLERVRTIAEQHFKKQTSRFEAELRLLNKRGKWQWVIARGQVVTRDDQGRPTRMIGTIYDIARSKEVEDKLLAKVQKLTTELAEIKLTLSRGDFPSSTQ